MPLTGINLKIKLDQEILLLFLLKDGRLVVYTNDKVIHIFNKSLKEIYAIKDINSTINSMIQTEEGNLVCSSYEITIIKLNNDNYEIIQKIKDWTNKIIEIKEFNNNEILNNNYIIAIQNNFLSSYHKNAKNRNLYKSNGRTSFDKNINNIQYLNNSKNDIVLILDDYFKNLSINIYNLIKKKIVAKIYETKSKESGDICLVNNKYLIVSFYLSLVLIDIENEYKVLDVIKTSFGCVNTFCYFKENIFFSGDDLNDIIEWKISNDKKIIKIKEYDNMKINNLNYYYHLHRKINTMIKYRNNNILVGGENKYIIFHQGE